MILVDPPPTQGDVHFRLFGFPIRVHPFFWIATLLLGVSGTSTPPAELLIWIIAVFLSIVIHELGHAFLQRRYGGRPRITLYALGGLAICDDCDRSTRSQILISLAGPFAGFLFAALVLIVLRLSGHQAGVLPPWATVNGMDERGPLYVFDILGMTFYWGPTASPHADQAIWDLLQINLLWGLVNLLPIYPLDGGRISREVCLLGTPQRGMVLSLQISVAAAVFMAVVGLMMSSWFAMIFFGYLAYSSYRTLVAYRASLW